MWFFSNRITRRYHHDHKKRGPHDHHHHHDHGHDVESRRSGTREIKVVRRVLDANDIMADRMRTVFTEKKVFVLNMMSSPGSGKTTTLQKTLARIMPEIRCAVIVGDICTTHDADRLAQSGAPVIQINTDEFGGDCHLAAHVVERAVADLDLDAIDLLIVENIGNLVCPAEFDIGEDKSRGGALGHRGRRQAGQIPPDVQANATPPCSTRSTCCPTWTSTWTWPDLPSPRSIRTCPFSRCRPKLKKALTNGRGG
jgi:hypothetical protein